MHIAAATGRVLAALLSLGLWAASSGSASAQGYPDSFSTTPGQVPPSADAEAMSAPRTRGTQPAAKPAGKPIAVPASANGGAASDAPGAVVRVEVPITTTRTQTPRGVQVTEELSTGAGVVLADGRVLTAYHLFRKAGLNAEHVGAVRVKPWQGGETTRLFSGDVHNWNEASSPVQFFPQFDLAIITPANAVKGVKGAPLARASAGTGETVRTFMTSTSRAASLDLKSLLVEHALNQPMMAVNGEAQPGDSGGPVFNARGELCAILVGGGPPFAPFTASVDWAAPAPFKFSTEGGQWRTLSSPTFLAVDVPAVLTQARTMTSARSMQNAGVAMRTSPSTPQGPVARGVAASSR